MRRDRTRTERAKRGSIERWEQRRRKEVTRG